MKLSHESKVRLGVGGLSFVALVAAIVAFSSPSLRVFNGASFTRFLREFAVEMPFQSPESRGFSSKFTKLSSTTLDADSVRSLDLDVTSGTVEVKAYDGNKVRVSESAHVAHGLKAARAATENLATVESGTLKVAKFAYDDEQAIGRVVTVEIPKKAASQLEGIDLNVRSGDLSLTGVTCKSLDLRLTSGDVEFQGGVTDTLTVDVGSGDLAMTLDQAPATAMNVTEGSGDIEISVPKRAGFTAELTMGSGDFDSDFLSDHVDGSDISKLTFDNGDKSADFRIKIGSGDMTLGAH